MRHVDIGLLLYMNDAAAVIATDVSNLAAIAINTSKLRYCCSRRRTLVFVLHSTVSDWNDVDDGHTVVGKRCGYSDYSLMVYGSQASHTSEAVVTYTYL